ncbi:MAG: hypothetical protein DHS20C05_00280 [Hyphococcus sp.]|nr:MAG: hypothetical protein DHS20C05_00280 [Marinicaulis sp.]
MKKLLLFAFIAGAACGGVAIANESEDFCVAFAEEHDLGTEPCSCIGEVSEANPDLKEALLALTDPSEVESWDEASKEAVAACFPERG